MLLAPGVVSVFASVGMLLVGRGLGALAPAAQVICVRVAERRPHLGASLAAGTINLCSFVGAFGVF